MRKVKLMRHTDPIKLEELINHFAQNYHIVSIQVSHPELKYAAVDVDAVDAYAEYTYLWHAFVLYEQAE
jgi:hypothetical protein